MRLLQRFLYRLNGKTHKVYTGVSLVKRNGVEFQVKSFYEMTDVKFAAVSDETIRGYVESGEPLDKAGGYGIQGLGSSLVESINGCYFNVMGFPVHKFASEYISFINNKSE
jgi:septum formation protein